jgi:hypothetical protein
MVTHKLQIRGYENNGNEGLLIYYLFMSRSYTFKVQPKLKYLNNKIERYIELIKSAKGEEVSKPVGDESNELCVKLGIGDIFDNSDIPSTLMILYWSIGFAHEQIYDLKRLIRWYENKKIEENKEKILWIIASLESLIGYGEFTSFY